MLRRILLLAFLCGASVSHASFWLAEPNEAAVIELVKATEAHLTAETPNLSLLEKKPSSSVQWDCVKNPFDLLTYLGMPSGVDAASQTNRRRLVGLSDVYEDPVIVPLSGGCEAGRLTGEVSFWYSVTATSTAFMSHNPVTRIYGRVAMIFREGSEPDFRSVNLYVGKKHSKGRYARAIAGRGEALRVFAVFHDGARLLSVRQRRQSGAITLETIAELDARTYENLAFTSNRHTVYRDGVVRATQTGSRMVSFDDAGVRSESVVQVEVPPREYPVRHDNKGVFMSPVTSDGVAAEWVNKVVSIRLGTKVAGMAGGVLGDAVGRQALGDLGGGMVGAAVGSRMGEAAGRQMALTAIGGEAALAATSDVSADSLADLAGWLYEEHRDNPRLPEIVTAAQVIYPELGKQYGEAVKDHYRRKVEAGKGAEQAFHARHLAAGREKWVPPLFTEYAAQFP